MCVSELKEKNLTLFPPLIKVTGYMQVTCEGCVIDIVHLSIQGAHSSSDYLHPASVHVDLAIPQALWGSPWDSSCPMLLSSETNCQNALIAINKTLLIRFGLNYGRNARNV